MAKDILTDLSWDTVQSDSVYWTGESRLWAWRRSVDRDPVGRSQNASSAQGLCRPQGDESIRSGRGLMGPRNNWKNKIKKEGILGRFLIGGNMERGLEYVVKFFEVT